jgi:hypothetical protein
MQFSGRLVVPLYNLKKGGEFRMMKRSRQLVGLMLTSFLMGTCALADSAYAYSPGTVKVYQPFPTSYGTVLFDYHTTSEYPNGEGQSGLLPGDVNQGWNEGGRSLAIDLVGLQPNSIVYFNGYNNNITGCSKNMRSGNRYVVDIWVQPPNKAKKYLGYIVMLHTQNNKLGSWSATADSTGRVTQWTSQVWDGPDGTNIYAAPEDGGYLCWTADHVHMFVSRDTSFESTYGTYTTGVTYSKNPFTQPPGGYDVTYDQAVYQFSVDWDK